MMRFLSNILFIVVLLLLITKPTFAQTTDLHASINGNNPLKPIITLTNTSDTACQVSLTDIGTIAITQLQQAGKIIKPVASEAAYEEAIDAVIANKLHTLKPGESVQIPLSVYQLGSTYFLKTVSWAPGVEPFDYIYMLNSNTQSLSMELNYSVPISITHGPPVCSNTFASTISASSHSFLSWLIILVIIVAIGIGGFLFLFRNKLHRSAAMTALLIIGLIYSLFHAPSAEATVNPGSLATQWNTCSNILNNNKDITGSVLNAVTDPNVTVNLVQTNNPTSDTQRTGPNSFIIYWNPNSTYQYTCGGSSHACTSVYHEMFHVYQMLNGTNNPKDCVDSGIPTNEVEATQAENKLRERLGLEQRTCYGNDTLPKDCGITPTPSPSPSPNPNGPGGIKADTHAITFDGMRYDFQGVGEFIAAKDPSGTYEVQVRQEPWFTSKQASVLTAVAMKVGSDKIELDLNKATFTMFLNGKQQTFQQMKLPGGGTVTAFSPSQAFVVAPDGSSALMETDGSYGMNLFLNPSTRYTGKLEGILGNDNGNTKDDLRLNGSAQPIQATFANLYPKFADSWRISNSNSLFTYEPSKNTNSYTDKSFPYGDIDVAQLPNHDAAQTICKTIGITEPITLQNCILDVAVTGRIEFAYADLQGQYLVHKANLGGTPWAVSIKKPGDTVMKQFSAKAGDKLFVDISGATFPDQCNFFKLLDANGSQLNGACIEKGSGFMSTTTLPITGTYTLSVTPDNNATGSLQAIIYFVTDKQASIIPDGPSVTTVFDKPGETARYTFQGTFGQRVFVNIPSSTLPDQCDIELQAPPTNNIISSGCIASGVGYVKTTTLPANGTYTIKIAPISDNTGQVQLNLISPMVQDQTMTIDGPAVTANITKSGSTALLHFSGKAGQKVYVDLSKSTFPTLCNGRVTLLNPEGNTIGYSCLTNSIDALAFSNGTVLPETGSYTVFVNPGDAATGSITVHVRSHQ